LNVREFFDRYGVALGVVAILAIVLAVLPGNANKRTSSTLTESGQTYSGSGANITYGGGGANGSGGAAGTSGGAGASASAGGAAGGAGYIPHGIGGAGVKPGVIFGKGLCRPDGRQVGISRYDPPCAEWIGGNGGATAPGVTPTTVRVVRWVGQVDPATQAILQANKLADDENTRRRSFQALFTYSNQHLMTYGRQVVLINYNSSGPTTSDEAMHADAINIAHLHAFAVIVGTPDTQIPDVLAIDLAHRGIVCICTVSPTSTFYEKLPPYIFGPGLPPGTLYAEHIAEYLGKRLNGRKAKWAGDPNKVSGYTTQTRKFGLLYLNGSNGKVDPEAINVKNEIVSDLAAKGVKLAAVVGYNYDTSRIQEYSTSVISQLRAAGVTTVIMWVDPLFPIFITQQATNQGYFPEWFITGSGLSDTTAAGRLYDQQQWQHAFGISPLSVLWQTVSISGGYRAAHHGDPSMQPGQEGALVNIYAAYVGNLFLGIHMAGPILTPDTYAQGMFRYPKTGGTAAFPLTYFTRDLPSAVKDFTEIWYDIGVQGYDERGNYGTGMMEHVAMGRRYQLGQWPATEPSVFTRTDATPNTDNPPGGGDPPHEQDGHHHSGACMSCPGFRRYK
jgi:hypothetical protein